MPSNGSSKRKRHDDQDSGEEVEAEGVEETSLAKPSRASALAAFTGTGANLASSIQTNSLDALRNGLSEIRTLTSLYYHDEKPSPSDKRIQLAKEFCQAGGIGESDPRQESGRGVLHAWDIIEGQDVPSVLPLPLFVLSNIIALLGVHQPTHELVDDLIQKILPDAAASQDENKTQSSSTNIYWNRLQTYLSNASGKPDATSKGKSHQSRGASEVVTLATIRLLLELSSFAGGKYSKTVFDHMNWTLKSLPKLLSMRRRVNFQKKGSKTTTKTKVPVTLNRPDIRSLWILFLLSFLRSSTGRVQPAILQSAALSLGRGFLPSILKGLANDPPQVVVYILMALHDGLLSDEASHKLSRSKVAGFFSEFACKELVALYDREGEMIEVANTEERHSVADVIHHFMLALCTHPGRGVCFIDQGWYGRKQTRGEEENEEEEEGEERRGNSTSNSGVYNKILLGLLKSLSPTRSPKQAELTLRILSASQELLGPFLNATTGSLSSASLEPRQMSIAWLSTAAFMGRALDISMPETSKWNTFPPSLERCLEFVLPTTLMKASIARGIVQKDRLTRHGALVLLSRILIRLHRFEKLCLQMSAEHDKKLKDSNVTAMEIHFKKSKDSIRRGEYESDKKSKGPWMKMRSDLLREAKLRVPDLTVILGSFDLGSPSATASKEGEKEDETVDSIDHHVGEVKIRKSFLITEAALRAARLHYLLFSEASSADVGKLLSSTSLFVTRQEETTDAEKNGEEKLSLVCQLHAIQLLTSYTQAHTGGIDFLIKQNNKDTSHLYHLLLLAMSPTLDQVRLASRDLIKSSITSTLLFEHNAMEWDVWQYALEKTSDSLLQFLDECTQRCLKTPYRYIEMGRQILAKAEDVLPASPLLFTMLEQYTIRLQNNLFGQGRIKVDFLLFIARLLPSLSTLASANIGFESILSKLYEAVEKSQEEAKEEMLSTLDETKLALQTMQTGRTAYESVDAHAEPTPILSRIFSTTTNKDLDDLNIDWSTLLCSRVEKSMVLVFIRNAILERSLDLSVIQRILNEVQHCGEEMRDATDDRDIEDLFGILFTHEKILDLCGKDLSVLAMLLESLTEAPLDSSKWQHRDCLKPLLEEAVDAYYPKDGIQATSKDRTLVISLLPFLDVETQDYILQTETDMFLLSEVLIGSVEWRASHYKALNRLLTAFEDDKDTISIGKVLIILQNSVFNIDFQKDGSYSDRPKQERLVQHIFSISTLSKFDDDVLCNILSFPILFTTVFWETFINQPNQEELVLRLPSSLAVAVETVRSMERTRQRHLIQVVGEGEDFTTSKGPFSDSEKILKVIQACMLNVFDANQSIALPLSRACLSMCPYISNGFFQLSVLLAEAMPKKPADAFKPSALLLAVEILRMSHDGTQPQVSSFESLFDQALLWLVRRFAEDEKESEETIRGVKAFNRLLENSLGQTYSLEHIKPHLAEPVLSAAIANRMDSTLHVRLVRLLLKSTSLKVTVQEKFILDILRNREALSNLESVKEVISIVFEATTKSDKLCNLDLVANSIKMYRGSLSKYDRKLMEVFTNFERVTKTSILVLLQQYWARSNTLVESEVDLGILSRMDSNRLHETSLNFPRSRGYEDLKSNGYKETIVQAEVMENVYDPLLVLDVVGSLLASDRNLSGLHWLELVRTNALGVVACCLSSTWPRIRSTALAILSKVYSCVTLAQFQEKDHLLLILDSIRNSYSLKDVADETSPLPLPLTTTLFASHSLRSLGIPSLYLYPLITRFLLQRPTPDPTDIPLLYNFLYSSSAQSTTYKAERIFMLRFLSTCLKYGGKVEWNILKRRHVWDSVCSLYTVRGIDNNVKRAIEDIFIAVSLNGDFAFRVIVRHAWLNFVLQLLLLESKEEKEESVGFWIHCLANILESIDIQRLKDVQGPTCFVAFSKIAYQVGQEVSEHLDLADWPYSSDWYRVQSALDEHS